MVKQKIKLKGIYYIGEFEGTLVKDYVPSSGGCDCKNDYKPVEFWEGIGTLSYKSEKQRPFKFESRRKSGHSVSPISIEQIFFPRSIDLSSYPQKKLKKRIDDYLIDAYSEVKNQVDDIITKLDKLKIQLINGERDDIKISKLIYPITLEQIELSDFT